MWSYARSSRSTGDESGGAREGRPSSPVKNPRCRQARAFRPISALRNLAVAVLQPRLRALTSGENHAPGTARVSHRTARPARMFRMASGDSTTPRICIRLPHRLQAWAAISRERRSYCTLPSRCAGSVIGIPRLLTPRSCLDARGLFLDRVEELASPVIVARRKQSAAASPLADLAHTHAQIGRHLGCRKVTGGAQVAPIALDSPTILEPTDGSYVEGRSRARRKPLLVELRCGLAMRVCAARSTSRRASAWGWVWRLRQALNLGRNGLGHL